MSEFQAKCSHNSFSQQDYYKQLQFDYKNIYQGGCRMLEFDLALKETNEAHDKQEDLTFTLVNELKIVYDFHKENKEHLPIFVTLNLKPWILSFDLESDQFYQNLENQILQVFQKDEDIYYPGQMLKGEENLYNAVQKYGQIKIGDIVGKVVFILDAALYNMKNQKFIQFYQNYHNDIKDRLMFATLDSRLAQGSYKRQKK
ncbi:PLC-like phosphodiesterase, TIM beta/alpha-barrel domain [Pseudocohnilembus persalinus]|uniref:PLC-like phosphodiesterase, TIM beta/alpha-barrel domain n=1 Tax=Pseudocohnilembus persalinus TaxID=266149 RepID=A0A0V0QZ36_PSEPJ|nr:PLC-like phosphodiesterase, TIM beta/alpha-barrel domain [Pseudocohnilembus persalinus]|eukprot:KRX07499.1 PLC-like phosphodiesterase, TIM beta/alpha-barrel domain [Pseudocohnilembus persalinus]